MKERGLCDQRGEGEKDFAVKSCRSVRGRIALHSRSRVTAETSPADADSRCHAAADHLPAGCGKGRLPWVSPVVGQGGVLARFASRELQVAQADFFSILEWGAVRH